MSRTFISVEVSESMKRILRRMAKRANRNVSWIVREIIRDRMVQAGEKMGRYGE